jgi:hypothetical protein
VADTEAKIAAWKTPNIHILEGDISNYHSLKVMDLSFTNTANADMSLRKPPKPPRP